MDACITPSVSLNAGTSKIKLVDTSSEVVKMGETKFKTFLKNTKSIVSKAEGNGKIIQSIGGGPMYAIVERCFRCGIGWFEFKLNKDELFNESTCFGLVTDISTLNDTRFDSIGNEMMLIRCYSGALYSNGRYLGISLRPVHAGSLVRFTINFINLTVSIAIDGIDFGVCFSEFDIKTILHPVVTFYGSNREVELTQMGYGKSPPTFELIPVPPINSKDFSADMIEVSDLFSIANVGFESGLSWWKFKITNMNPEGSVHIG